jgi:hypothetical protein
MKCLRCEGLMISQAFIDAIFGPDSWKCLNCGNTLVGRENGLEFDSFSMFNHQKKIKRKK